MTCVRFFLGRAGNPPSSYSDLYQRTKFLHLAKTHLENLLKERTSTSSFVSHVGAAFLGEYANKEANKEASVSEIKRYLNTVQLQLDVTEFLFKQKNKDSITVKGIPTLFGNGKERAELAIQVRGHSFICNVDMTMKNVYMHKFSYQ